MKVKSLKVSEVIHQALKVFCAEAGMPIQQFVEATLRRALREQGMLVGPEGMPR